MSPWPSLRRRTGETLSVALIDVDHFKQVNDQHGHLVGDAVLRNMGGILADRLRGTDLVGRYGGEEFVVIMRRSSAEDAREVLDAIRRTLDEREGTPALPRYTFSAGVAELGPDGSDVEALLARADQRLYQAKDAGRNRIA